MKRLRLTLAVASLACLSVSLAYLPTPEKAMASTQVADEAMPDKPADKPVTGVVSPAACTPAGCPITTRGLLAKRTRTVEKKVETTATTEVKAEKTRRQPVRNILDGVKERKPLRAIAGRLLRRR